MSKIAVRATGVSKQYRLGSIRDRHHTLRDHLAGAARNLFTRHRHGASNGNTLWALKDVSFDVEQGEVLGIIGRNGAGKSTLLKILSRITQPTEGRLEVYGRIGALLEVGTGFHPELSGRENIYFSGAILGMTKQEIHRKFDEIVSFAELERFIDTPVKRYSSGMYVRLAFAVAAHLEPEILVLDEVLSVGDFAFQKKCLAKMADVASHGRTVLFVSHNFDTIKTFCKRTLLLDHGRIVTDAAASDSVEQAVSLQQSVGTPTSFRVQTTIYDDPSLPKPVRVEVRRSGGSPDEPITFDDGITVTLELDSPIRGTHTFAFAIMTPTGVPIVDSFYRDHPANVPLAPGRTTIVSITIPPALLPGGRYEAAFFYMFPNADILWMARDTWFEVHDVDSYLNHGLLRKRGALVAVRLPWSWA